MYIKVYLIIFLLPILPLNGMAVHESLVRQLHDEKLHQINKIKNIAESYIESKVKVDDPKLIDLFHQVICYPELVDVLDKLIHYGLDINAKNKGWSPLYHAISQRNLKAVKKLLINGADTEIAGKYDITPLRLAVQLNRKKMIKLLLKYEADINSIDNVQGNTPLIDTVNRCTSSFQSSSAELVSILLDSGADVRYKNKEGDTALSIAQRNKFAKIVQVIKKKYTLVDRCLDFIEKNQKLIDQSKFDLLPQDLIRKMKRN